MFISSCFERTGHDFSPSLYPFQGAANGLVPGLEAGSLGLGRGAWGLGLLVLGFFTTRLIFRKKELPRVEKTTYSRSRSTLVQMAKGQLLKRLLLAFEPLLTSVVKDRIPSASKPPSSHV